jgi:cysteine desulfurase
MLPYFREHYGNAASRQHPFGWDAGKAVERAREQVAGLIGARFRDVIFTSGATESNNLAIKGLSIHATRRRIVTVQTEHRAVLDPCRTLEAAGFEVTWLGVRRDGIVDLDELRDAVTEQTLLVSVMAGNNEIGVLQPINAIGEMAHARGALFHCDAVQAAGVMPIDVKRSDIDFLSLSAHKIYGPKGVGALYVSKGRAASQLAAIIDGGGHERGYRSGTLNVPGIVGFGSAAEICVVGMAEEAPRLAGLRDRLWARLHESLSGIQVNGSLAARLPQNLNVTVEGVHGETLLKSVASELAVSSGAACATASAEPSHVLKALGLNDDQARASLRFGVGRFNSEQEMDRAADVVAGVVKHLRRSA